MTPGRQAPASSSGGCHLGLGRLASAALLPLLLLLLLGRLLGCRRCHCLLLLHHLGWGEAVDVVDHIPPDLGLQAPGRGWHRGWGVIEGSGVGGTAGWFAFGRWHRVCVLSWGPGCVGAGRLGRRLQARGTVGLDGSQERHVRGGAFGQQRRRG